MSEPNLPAVPDDGVLDGTVIEPEPERQRPVYVLQPVVQRITVIVQHPVPRATVRHAGYVPAGAVVAFRRWRRRRTLASRMAETVHLGGDSPMALQLLQQAEAERNGRASRWKQRLDMALALLRVSPLIIGLWALAMLATGACLAFAHGSLGYVLWPWKELFAFVSALVTALEVLVWVLAFGIPLGFTATLWHFGRHPGEHAPGWSLAPKQLEEDRGLVVTADGIVVALQNTPGAALKKAFKEDWRPAFHTTPVRDGEGYFSVFSVPLGVTANDIADQVGVFARNLHRAQAEVWVTDAERDKIAPAGYVALWVANPGVLDRGAPEYPLMHEGQADVFAGVPGGVVARGDGVLIPVVSNNLVLGGQMGMGKSNAGRVFILGCATDPLCELNVFVFANNGDFDEFAPRLAIYVKGADDDTAGAAVRHLHDLLDEVSRREARLAELGAKKLTRRIAEQNPDMRPVVSLFSECHELFGSTVAGELAAELAVKVIKRARKTGIVLAFDTQSSRAGAIPPALVELVSVNVCFYVKTWRSNDGFLGDGSFQAGIRATELRPTRDVGRAVVTGISDAQFDLLKWYFVEVDNDTGWDAATEVIARCMRDLAPGTKVSGSDSTSLPVVVVRDLLDDVAEVIDGPDRVRLAELAYRLQRLDRVWYRGLDGVKLREQLAGLEVRTTNPKNVPTLDPADIPQRGELAVPCPRTASRSPPR